MQHGLVASLSVKASCVFLQPCMGTPSFVCATDGYLWSVRSFSVDVVVYRDGSKTEWFQLETFQARPRVSRFAEATAKQLLGENLLIRK